MSFNGSKAHILTCPKSDSLSTSEINRLPCFNFFNLQTSSSSKATVCRWADKGLICRAPSKNVLCWPKAPSRQHSKCHTWIPSSQSTYGVHWCENCIAASPDSATGRQHAHDTSTKWIDCRNPWRGSCRDSQSWIGECISMFFPKNMMLALKLVQIWGMLENSKQTRLELLWWYLSPFPTHILGKWSQPSTCKSPEGAGHPSVTALPNMCLMLRNMFGNAVTSKETAPAPNAIAHTALPEAKKIIARMECLRQSRLGWHSSGNWPSGMGGFGSGITIRFDLLAFVCAECVTLHRRRQADQNAGPLSRILWLHSFFEPRLAQDVLGRANVHMFANCVLMNAIFWARWDCCISELKSIESFSSYDNVISQDIGVTMRIRVADAILLPGAAASS